MFDKLLSLFFGPKVDQESVTTQKLKRFRQARQGKVVNIDTNTAIKRVKVNSLAGHWTPQGEQQGLSIGNTYRACSTDPELLLQPGVAEAFTPCRENPVDEFRKARDKNVGEITIAGARFFPRKKSA